MKKLLLFVLFLLPLLAQAQYRGLFLPDNKGGTTLATNEKRIALVVGNKNYSNGWGSLRNSVNDANAMTSALQDCGFEVTTLTDASRSQFLEAIRTFKGKIVGSSTVALFFYAGHGLEESGQNYLIPSDDGSKCRNEIEDNGIKLSSIQKQLKDAGAAMSILVVDACRNQPMPFTCPSSDRSGTSSTFKEFSAKGSYIAFSTAPGKTASDGSGINSPYTAALSRAIRQEGLKIEDVFKQVRRELDQIGQETWDNNGYSGDFYFKYKTQTNVVVNNNNTTQDSDGDGIIDSKDGCPYEYGEVSNNGCPKNEIQPQNNNVNYGKECKEKGDEYYKSENYTEAIKWYRKSAEQGNSGGQNDLGYMYQYGQGIDKDYVEAVKWYRKSAEQGNSDAQTSLGLMYFEGNGVSQDSREALKWLKKSAELGNAEVQGIVGVIYYNGNGVSQDYNEALKWLQKSAYKGSAFGQAWLGEMYYTGNGVSQDYREALKWLLLSAEQGNVPAQVKLGNIYCNGLGVGVDYKMALDWYKKSAEQNDAVAQNNLGTMYADGNGVKEDFKEAVYWYKKSAEQNYSLGQLNLANKYEMGSGVKKDINQAKYWYKKACENGNSFACKYLQKM